MKNETWIWILVAALIGVALMSKDAIINPVIEKMAQAIKEFEGWRPGSVSYRNNNPGNLKLAGQPGAIGADNQGHAIFATYDDGWTALINQLRAAFGGWSHVYNPGMSIAEFFQKYAEGNQASYALYVSNALGVSPDTKLSEL